jgi:hypothetical protein
MIKNIFCLCQYAANTAYKGRKEVNEMRQDMGFKTRQVTPPPTFPSLEASSDDNSTSPPIPPDQETLAENIYVGRTERRPARPQRYTATTHRAGRAIVTDSEDESKRRIVSSGKKLATPSDSDIGSDWSRDE